MRPPRDVSRAVSVAASPYVTRIWGACGGASPGAASHGLGREPRGGRETRANACVAVARRRHTAGACVPPHSPAGRAAPLLATCVSTTRAPTTASLPDRSPASPACHARSPAAAAAVARLLWVPTHYRRKHSLSLLFLLVLLGIMFAFYCSLRKY